ncbi:MAG: cation:proton antiporter [Deltaproteobacteria bacterium]
MSRGRRLLAALRAPLALLTLVGLTLAAERLAPAGSVRAAVLVALGLLLLAGDLAAELVERLGLPHLTGYLLAGIAVGPHGLGLVPRVAVDRLGLVNALALALIALSAGAELTAPLLRQGARTLGWAVAAQLAIALPASILAILLLRPFVPFMAAVGLGGALGMSLLWGVVSVSRSPAAVLGVVSELRPAGPITRYALTVVVAFDVVVLVLFALALALARGLSGEGGLSLARLTDLGQGMLGAIACGTTLGLLVALYLRLSGRQLLLFLVLVAYGATSLTAYFHYESMLLFMCAGFVVTNVTGQGERLLHAIANGGRVVYVIFFALAGAHLDLGLLEGLWPVAIALTAVRALSSVVAARVGSRLARDPPAVARDGWMPLISQAGVTIGLAVLIAERFPTFGRPLEDLAIAVIGLNELVGPVLFKWALDRNGEVGQAARPAEPGEALALP